VETARERSSIPHMSDELEGRLAVAVLEVLATQPEPMGSQQHISLGTGYDRDLLRRVE
jgi:hypothetical protein